MPLIIFNKTQRVSFQRFGYSVVAGAVGIWLLARLHDFLHYDHKSWFVTADVDIRLILCGVLFAVLFCLVYLWTSAPPPLDFEVVNDEHLPSVRHVGKLGHCRNWSRRIFLANVVMIIAGLIGLVWVPLSSPGFSLSWSLEQIALHVFAIFLPINYAGKLYIENCMSRLPKASWWFAKQTLEGVLYWVLVVYWAALIAAYLLLLANSPVYCKYFLC